MLSRKNLAEAIAEAWNQHGINYTILHGLEEYPRKLGRDLDVFVDKPHIKKAAQLTIKVMKDQGWPIVIQPRDLYGRRIIAFSNDWEEHLEVDLKEELRWTIIDFAKRPFPRYQFGPFKVDPWANFVKRIFLVLLSEGVTRFKEKPDELQIRDWEREELRQIEHLLGARDASRLIEKIESFDLDGLNEFAKKLRRKLLLRALLSPISSLPAGCRFLKRRILEHIAVCGPIVAIVGPDGVGKSTSISALYEHLPSLFTRIQVRHWRPGLLPQLGRLIGKETPQGAPPRRHPGRFQILRLGYYLIDFWLGYLIKDSVESSKQRVIIYDRCALDMVVDPRRFGLRHKWGAKLLWRLVPKPDLVILLWDKPDKITKRKSELSENEICDQLRDWAFHLNEGDVDTCVAMDADPPVIARRILQLVMEEFINKNGGNIAVPKLDGQQVLRIIQGCGEERLKEASANEKCNHKDGEYTFFPNVKDGKVFLPCDNKKVAATALRAYNPMKIYARIATKVAAAGYRTGLMRLFLRGPTVKGPLSIEQHLRDVLGVSNLRVAISLGTPGVHQKPVAQAMDEQGKVLAYVKIGWNQETISLTWKEENVLKHLTDKKFHKGEIPRILHSGWWNGCYLLVLSAPQGQVRKAPLNLTADHIEFIRELNGIEYSFGELSLSDFWSELLKHIAKARDLNLSYDADLLERVILRIEKGIGKEPLLFAFTHGDFTPWNTFQLRDKLYVFDWEYARSNAPIGWDLFHFLTQKAILVDNNSPGKIWKEVLNKLSCFFSEYLWFQMPIERLRLLFALYIASIFAWYLARDGVYVDKKGFRLRATWRALLGIFLTDMDIRSWSEY